MTSEPTQVVVRFAKRGVFLMVAVLAGIGWLWAEVWWGNSGNRAGFQAFVDERADAYRCRTCDLPYESAVAVTGLPLAMFSILLLIMTVVAIRRAFGPPTLEIDASGRGIYRLPWRVVSFEVAPDAHIKVGPRFRFDPAVRTDDGQSLSMIRFRTFWADASSRDIRRRLSALRPDWRVD